MNAPQLATLTHVQSAVDPASFEAGRISHLWWFYLAVLLGVFTLVVSALMCAIVMNLRKKKPEMSKPASLDPHRERMIGRAVVSAVFATIAILAVLFGADLFAELELTRTPPPDALNLLVTGHQWWWEIRYENSDPSQIITTANEIHLPLGRAVNLNLQSADVIHSLWIPNLHGKKDLVPGHPSSFWFVPKQEGTFYGQCAEFCGLQHAHMRLTVTVDKPERFEQWCQQQRTSAPTPVTESQKKGREVFLHGTCFMCHSIQGTPAQSKVGPDLTHVASRATLAAGEFPNVRGYLAGWILDPQTLKPGVRMPQHLFRGEDLNALLDYLETLH